MSTFLTGKELEEAIYDIIWSSERKLLIVSPFIKLDDYFKSLFNKHKHNHNIHLILVFGKNERAVKRSMSKADFDYFKEFRNVSIIYVPNLHAKYYGNEKMGMISSINLYDYSFKNNIEFGVFSEQSILDRFKKPNADHDAWNTSMKIAEENEVVFIRRPVYENKRMIISLGKNYITSEILFDSTEKFYGLKKSQKSKEERLNDFPAELEIGTNFQDRPERATLEEPIIGFCIRSGQKIKYNPQQPMSYDNWKKWNEYANEDYPEKYCHRTGVKSNGKTTMKNPILS
tara:strand:- start:551 stop:1411 length:861 start_codon:yes stop_codon:yes gene_type:complete